MVGIFRAIFFSSEGMASKNILYGYVDTTIKWLTENKIEYIWNIKLWKRILACRLLLLRWDYNEHLTGGRPVILTQPRISKSGPELKPVYSFHREESGQGSASAVQGGEWPRWPCEETSCLPERAVDLLFICQWIGIAMGLKINPPWIFFMLSLLFDTILFTLTGRLFDSILKVISKNLIIPIVTKICP